MLLRDFKIIDEPYVTLKNGITTFHLKPGPPSPLETAARKAGIWKDGPSPEWIEDELLPRETCIKL